MAQLIETHRHKRPLIATAASLWEDIVLSNPLDAHQSRTTDWNDQNESGFSLATWASRHGCIDALDYIADLTLKDGRGQDCV